MILSELNKGIYYVGVNDRTSSLFESLWSLPAGVSYNSYIVKGDKTALIDTVHISKAKNFIANIKTAIGESPIDYVVIGTRPLRCYRLYCEIISRCNNSWQQKDH